MLASDLISQDIFPLKKTDTVEAAMVFMQDWKVLDLPVVDSNKVLGYCDFHDLIGEKKKTRKVADFIRQDKTYIVSETQHLFEVVKVFAENQLITASVVNNENLFKGIISLKELLFAYKQSALIQPGGIITLQMPARNYSLAEISRLIEYNDIKILHVFIKKLNDENDRIEVSIKLNTPEVKNSISTLERYQYNIISVHQAAEIEDNFQSRFDYLIKYLNT